MRDLEDLANYAYHRKDYPIAVDICRRILVLVNLNPSSMNLKKRIQHLAIKISNYNNAYLKKYQCFIANHHRMLTYTIDEKLHRKQNQPDYVLNGSIYEIENVKDANVFEWLFTQTCQNGPWLRRRTHFEKMQCRYLHHKNPFLKLGPFLEECVSIKPYVVLLHGLLDDNEIEYLIQVSKPDLTRQRNFSNLSGASNINDIKTGRIRRIVEKSVQTWISEVQWPSLTTSDDWVGKNHLGINHPILWSLNKKISLATQLVTDTHGSATVMQVTNYGLGGLCEKHIDPIGIMEQEEKHTRTHHPHLLVHGDIGATVMAWLSKPEAGGGTVYMSPGYEGIVMPERGTAAFWYDLKSDGIRDQHSLHAGCPVLKGTKWIMNKWLHMFDNFRKFPCKLKAKEYFDRPSSMHYF